MGSEGVQVCACRQESEGERTNYVFSCLLLFLFCRTSLMGKAKHTHRSEKKTVVNEDEERRKMRESILRSRI